MKYLEYVRELGIRTFPIRYDIIDTDIDLEDGSKKKKKKLLRYDFANVTTNDFNNKKLCDRRWKEYENGNINFEYNAFAVDTSEIGCLDYDSILTNLIDGEENPFKLILDKLPYKKSNTKAFGKHVLFDRTFIPTAEKRRKRNFPDKYGKMEFLDGLWEWAGIDDEIEYPERSLKSAKNIIKKLITPIINNIMEEYMNNVVVAEPVVPPVPDEPIDDTYYQNIKKNIEEWTEQKNQGDDRQKCGGLILACAVSQDHRVYSIILEHMRKGKNYENDKWISDTWFQYNAASDAKYRIFWSKLCPQYVTTEFSIFDLLEDSDKFIEKDFWKRYNDRFLVNTLYTKHNQQIAYYNNGIWEHGTDVGKLIIEDLIINMYDGYKKDWTAKMDKLGNTKYDAETKKSVKALLRKFHAANTWSATIANKIYKKMLRTESMKNKIQFNLMPITKHYIQFDNGAFNLKTGLLERKTREMYISQTLDYSYKKVELFDDIDIILKQILPEEKYRIAALRWRGLCLTGVTKEQKFVLNVGEAACNGKSTQSMIFEKCFPLYTKKIGNDTFDKGAKTMFNKAMSSMANKPIRLVYMEEWGEEAQDTNLIKQTIGSSTLTVKPLYQEEIEMSIQFKLEAGSNYNPNTKSDNGLNRRGAKFEYESRFVDAEDVDESKHMYLKNIDLLSLFDDDDYKLSYFNLLAPYAKLYYEEGLVLPAECETMFQEACEEGDEWVDFLDDFEFSTEDIHKDDMVEIAKDYFNLPTITAVECKREFKKRGFKYESQKIKTVDILDWKNEKTGQKERKKGYFVGIKRKDLKF